MARYDSEGIEIPQGKIYVTMTDSFMSEWGMSRGKKNRLVFVCDTEDEANIVADNAEGRSDMKSISVIRKLPEYSLARYYIQVKTKEDYPQWYKEGYFLPEGDRK